MAVRRGNFPPDIYFYLPSIKHYETDELPTPLRPSFVPVSVTGCSCRLMCDHCRARLLESMYPAEDPWGLLELGAKLARNGVTGILVTGGSDAAGRVPVGRFADSMRELKDRFGFKIVVHTGLVGREDARRLARAGIDAAMLDVIGSDVTLRDVYHLNATVADFEASLSFLAEAGIPVSPHVVIGIHYGEILGERRALEMISRVPISSLVLVVLSPLPGTPMEGAAVLTGPELIGIFAEARLAFPVTPILLGCARPEGKQKYGIDRAALAAGLNGIAFPAEGIVSLSEDMGFRPVCAPHCCSLIFQDLA